MTTGVQVLEVHHIDEDRKNNDIKNLIVLCPICHKYLSLHIYALEYNNNQWKFTECDREGNNNRNKPIAQIDDNNKIIKIFQSIASAAREINRSKSSLSYALRNRTNCAGYRWEYKK